jgi:hypothetical protein
MDKSREAYERWMSERGLALNDAQLDEYEDGIRYRENMLWRVWQAGVEWSKGNP